VSACCGIHEMGVMPEIEIGRVEEVDFDVGLSVATGATAGVGERQLHVEHW